MLNLPTITAMEIAVVGTALLVLYVLPSLMARIDERRRRRVQPWTDTFTPSLASTPAASETAEPPAERSAQPPRDAATAETASAETLSSPQNDPIITATAPLEEEESSVSPEPLLQPFEGQAGHGFRLEDLHRVRLADWPPATVRNDPARHQVWREAERVAEAHRASILSPTLLSPYPVRSACLGGAEKDSATFRLRYFLFPSLWPVSRDQAVAHVTFEVDSATGVVRHRIDALRASDLSEDTRRAIRESGGEI